MKHLGAALALSILVAGCGGTAPASQSAASYPQAAASGAASMDQLYEAAKKEGEVGINNQDPESEKLSVDAVTKRYPGIKLTYQVGRGTDVPRKLITQAQGHLYPPDVFSAGPH